MADVYSTNFFNSHAGGPSSFQCPAGYRAVLRQVTVFNADTLNPRTGHLIHSPSNCTIFQWVVAPPATDYGAQVVLQLLHYVFNEGESISTANDGSIDMTCSGFLLTLP